MEKQRVIVENTVKADVSGAVRVKDGVKLGGSNAVIGKVKLTGMAWLSSWIFAASAIMVSGYSVWSFLREPSYKKLLNAYDYEYSDTLKELPADDRKAYTISQSITAFGKLRDHMKEMQDLGHNNATILERHWRDLKISPKRIAQRLSGRLSLEVNYMDIAQCDEFFNIRDEINAMFPKENIFDLEMNTSLSKNATMNQSVVAMSAQIKQNNASMSKQFAAAKSYGNSQAMRPTGKNLNMGTRGRRA